MATTDFFKDMAKKAKARNEEEQKNRGSGGQSFSPLLWTAFEDVGSSKVIRFYHDLIAQKKEDLDIVDGQGNKIFDKYAPSSTLMYRRKAKTPDTSSGECMTLS